MVSSHGEMLTRGEGSAMLDVLLWKTRTTETMKSGDEVPMDVGR